MAKWAILTVFGDFWWLSLRATFEVYRAPEMPFSQLNMKIGCLEHVWVPSVHRAKSGTYTLKMRLKIFGIFYYGIFGHFGSDLTKSHYKTPSKMKFGTLWDQGSCIEPLGTLRRGLRVCGMGPFLTKISPKQPKMPRNQLFWFSMFANSIDIG